MSAVYLYAVGNYCGVLNLGEIWIGLQFEKKASALKTLVWSRETDYEVSAGIRAEMSSSDNSRKREESGKDLSYQVQRLKISNHLIGREREELRMNP